MKSKIRRLLLVCLLAFCLFVPTNVLGGDISTAPMMPIMPPIANVEELELLPVDPLHVHDFSWGPYYESIHRAGLGHREYYFCSANDGYTQLTGSYGDYPGCSECENPHEHSYTWGPYYESTHRAGLGHREYYFCSANDGATQVTGNYDTYPGCEICFPPAHTCSPSGTYTEDAHPHQFYRIKCEDSNCTNGNYGDTEYVGITASWSWSEPGTLSSTHTNSGHALTKNCSYTGCSETQTTYVAYNEDCTTCNPPHVCVSSTTHTEAAHPHRHYYYVCENLNCPYGNEDEIRYNTTNATTWEITGGSSSPHHQSLGHYIYKKCKYDSCTYDEEAYYLISGCIMCYPPESDTKLKVLVDDAAYAYYNSMNPFYDIVSNATTAFALRWNMQWETSISQAPADLPYNNCPLADNAGCDHTASASYGANRCSSQCTSHHKNTTNNLNWMISYYNANLSETHDLFLTLSGTAMCLIHPTTGVHATATFGAASTIAPVLTAKYAGPADEELETNSIRALQHELSHKFGCDDYVCTPGQKCIMGPGFDKDDEWEYKDIWCDNCLASFDPTLY